MCHIKMHHCHTIFKYGVKNVTSMWCIVTSLFRKCHIKVKHCHITFKYSLKNVTSMWCIVTSLLRKCHIKVKHCHITLAFWGIFRTLRMYFRGFRGIFPWPVAFCDTKCVSGEAKIDTFQVVLGFRQRNQSQKMMKKIIPKNSFHKPAPTQSRIFLSSYL